MYIKKKLLLVCLVVFGVITGNLAQNTKEENKEKKDEKKETYYRIEQVEKIVVTATMTPKAIKDCSASVNIIGKREIASSSSTNALNILNHCSGIFVNRTGDFGRADVEIRGLGQNCRKIAVLVDGKPEKMGLFGCAVSHTFPLDNVEHIEVVKGPASVLYGGEALGGAVNIITRMPENNFETNLSAFYGSFNTRQYNLKHGGNLDKFRYFLTYDNRKSDGHIENADYSGQSFTSKMVYEPTENTRVSLKGKYFDGRKSESGTIDEPISDYWNDYKRGSLDLSFTRRWNKSDFSLKVYRNFGKHKFSDGWDSRDYTNGVIARFTTQGIESNELVIGGDVRIFGGKTYSWPEGEWDKKEGSFFIQNEFIFHTKWILSTGIRFQFDSIYGQEICPQLGIVFHFTNHTLFRGTVRKGFRSPQINELYMFPSANQDLEPERAWNYEVGFEHKINKNVTLKGSTFYMKGTNIIQTVPNNAPPPKYIFSNTGEFSFYGIEAELKASISRHFFGDISYSFMNYGNYTRGKPGQKVDFSLWYKKKKFFARLEGQYVMDYYAGDFSKDRIPSYFLLNSRLMIQVIKRLELIVDVKNILNKNYSIYGEFPGLSAGLYRMPDRNFQIGLHFFTNQQE